MTDVQEDPGSEAGSDGSVADATPAPSPVTLRWVARGLLVLAGLGLFGLGWAVAPRDEAPTTTPEGHAAWTCAMHPEIRLPSPGACPICAMDLVEVDGTAALRPNRVELSERARALARLRTAPVTSEASEGASLRLLGRVDYDETTLATVTSWVGGRLDRLHVRTTGATLRRGQRVASVYSPEVHAASHDLIVAHRQLDRLADATPLAQTAARRTLEAAQSRLSLLGVPDAEVERMRNADRPPARIAVRSPFSGTVVERLAAEGETLAPGDGLYRVADLRRLWVQLDAYEADLPHVRVGQEVTLRIDALGAETFDGRVAFIDPVIDPVRRTARVRVEVDNPDARLRPGMDARAALARGQDSAPSIPASAPLFTGRRSLVYVDVPDTERPTYEAREVHLGARVGDTYPVIAGLTPGERVVVHGAFVLDADQQLSGHPSMMNGQLETLAEGAVAVPEDFRVGLQPTVEAVLQMASHLAADDFDGARQDTDALLAALDAFTPTEPADAAASYRPLADALGEAAARAQQAGSIEALRRAHEPIVDRTSALLARFGNPLPEPLRLAHCPMAFDGRGAVWLQRGERIDNAYFGAAMQTCGSIRQTLPPGAHLREAGR